ncbi:MAG: Mth938-like domain-containing protein [Nitrososphaerota archaeon]|nr:Mth938-like domain-containing protein [Nitrososphaerota archaeon]
MRIDSYEFGKIVIDGKEYRSDVIIYPDRVDSKWWRKVGHELCIDDIKDIINEKPEVLVVGTGYNGYMKVLPETKKFLESRGVELIVEKTTSACEIYNQLSRSKKVVAALHLTC